MGKRYKAQSAICQCGVVHEKTKKKPTGGRCCSAAGSCLLPTCAFSRLLCVLWLSVTLEVAAIPRGTIRQWLHRQI